MRKTMMKFVYLSFACAIFFACGFSWCPCAPAQQVIEPSPKQLSVNGTTIRYWEQGRGAAVVFVHGAISDHRYWEPQREAVAKNYRFIALDRRYFGTAPWPDRGGARSEATDVADLAAFIRELKSGPVFLVGISGGAGVSILTALQHPKVVRGLFVHEPGLDSIVTDPADRKAVSELRQSRHNTPREAAKAGNMEEAARLFVDSANGQPGSFDGLAPELKAMFVDNARVLTLNGPTPVPVTCAQLGQLKIPVTITKGQLTKPARKILAEAAQRCIPGATLITIPAASHGASRQNPSAFNEALLRFLGQN
jgi:pimeloyl-ACP methyl ester carboxylesterase